MNIQVARAAGAPLADIRLSSPRDRFVLKETAVPASASARPRRAFRVRPLLAMAMAFLVLLLMAAIHPALLTSIDPQAADARDAFLAPGLVHWLGTDENGRDVLARLIYGVRASLLMGVTATIIGVVGGILVGLSAGLGGKLLDGLLMRLVDVLLSFPDLLLALAIITFWGQGLANAIVAVGVASIPRYARLARAQSQIVRSAGYVEAAATLGLRRSTLIWRHILPNAIKPILVLATIGVGGKIAAGAALSFLGFGAPPPAPEWGAMLSMGRNYLANAVWLVVAPGTAITLTVLAVTAVGRELLARSEGVRR
jgi:peptide/nickel transport system permease protein